MSDSRGLQLFLSNDRRLLTSSRQGVPLIDHSSRYSITPSSTRRRSARQSLIAPRNSFGLRSSSVSTTAIAATPLHRKSSLAQKGIQLINSSLPLQEARARNRAYMELLLREVHDFCTANNFEAEMNHRIPLAKYDKLTHKDFLCLFGFLYGKLDSNFNTVLHESDIKTLLRNISYPGVEKIRDISSATGEQNWPQTLAMLYWLVKLNLMLLNVNDEAEFIAPTAPIQKVFCPFIFSSYSCFMEEVDDSLEQEMLYGSFNEFKEDVALKKQESIATIDKLSEEKRLLSIEYKRIDEAEDMTGKLETDIRSLNKYIGDLQEGYDMLRLKDEALKSSIASLEDEMMPVLKAKESFISTLGKKGIDMDQLAKIEEEESRIRRAIDVIFEKLKITKDRIKSAHEYLLNAAQDLDTSINRYNSTIHRIPVFADVEDLTFNEQIVEDYGRRFDAENILSRPLRQEKEHISRIDVTIKSETLANEEKHMLILQQIEEYKQILSDYEHTIATLETSLSKERSEITKMQTKKSSDAKNFEDQIKSLESIIDAIKSEMKFETLEAQTVNTNLRQQLAQTQSIYEKKRQNLQLTVHTNLDSILTLKDHVSKIFETIKAQAMKELENEKRRETGT